MKLHWGHGIVTGGLLFMGFVVYMTSQMIGQKVDLVAPDYYEKGIRYQQEMEQNRLARQDVFEMKLADSLYLRSKAGTTPLADKELKLEFYRPSATEMDFSATVTSGQDGSLSYAHPNIVPGLWKIKVSWQEDGQTRFSEQSLYKP